MPEASERVHESAPGELPGTSAVMVELTDRRSSRSGTSSPPVLVIDCGECEHQHTSVCDDCVVSFIVDRDPEDAVIIDADELRAVRALEKAGLMPGSRHHLRPVTG